MKAFGFEITFAEVENFFKSWISRLGLFCVVVICGVMVFAPERIVTRLQLASLRDWLGTWLGILFVFSSIFLIVPLVCDEITKYKLSRLFKGKDADARINQLSPIALGYLCEMYLRPDHAGRYDFTDPSFVALRDGAMVRISQMGNMYSYPCYLQPWVICWLDDHQEIVSDYQNQVKQHRKNNPYSSWF